MRRIEILCVLLVVLLLLGCSSGEAQKGTFFISYLNKDQTQIVKESYEPSTDVKDTTLLLQELIGVLATDSGSLDFVKPIPDEVKVKSIKLNEYGIVHVTFTGKYEDLLPVQDVLCRVAIVQTLTQVDDVKGVEFSIGKNPLCDSRGRLVGVMTMDDIVENPGELINSIQQADIDLYFSNATGDGLTVESQTVYYNSNVSLEKLVIEHLLAGPKKTEGAQASIPAETSLVNVSVADRVCYVSLDEGFLTQNYDIQEPIVIYSLVNSLTALPHIDRVQISVNGDTSGTYREKYSLSTVYEQDLSFVDGSENQTRSVVVNDIKEEDKNPLE